MAIVALAGKSAVVTINSVTVKIARGRFRIGNQVLKFMVTGETPDSDSQYWERALSGNNSWSFEGDGYIDHAATAAARLVGTTINIRPGTSAAGVLSVLFASGDGFTGTGVVESTDPGFDAESTKPDTFRFTITGDGALVYVNS